MNDLRKKARQFSAALYLLDHIYQDSERKRGIKDAEACLLYALDDGKTHSQKQICDAWEIPRTTLNTIVKQWERSGYLELRPIPGKRRDREIVLTEAGKAYAQPFLEFIYRAEEPAMEATLQRYSEEFIEAIEFFCGELQKGFEAQIDLGRKERRHSMNKTGFGFLRLPHLGEDKQNIDYGTLNSMVDRFLELGGRYFDTAYTYLNGVSEEALRRSLVERHSRDAFQIADKLPGWKVKSHDQCREYFDEQLRRCGVDFFDVYLIHWLNGENYRICEETDQFRFLREVKASGEARAIGFSYHDGPEVDYVQLQINYLDWDSPALRARACCDVAARHGKRIVVMEPVKGGSLASPPAEAEALLKAHAPGESAASWAIRFASSLPAVETVLSGMNTMEQIEDNLRPLAPLSREERSILARAADIIRENTAVACTGCSYCTPNCPMCIQIPRYFALYNDYKRSPGEAWKMQYAYDGLADAAGPGDCIACGQCEKNCPQNLKIIEHLKQVREAFES